MVQPFECSSITLMTWSECVFQVNDRRNTQNTCSKEQTCKTPLSPPLLLYSTNFSGVSKRGGQGGIDTQIAYFGHPAAGALLTPLVAHISVGAVLVPVLRVTARLYSGVADQLPTSACAVVYVKRLATCFV